MPGSFDAQRAELCSVIREGAVLRLRGEIDQSNAAAITDRIVAEVRSGARHLDLTGVHFLAAAGVRALLMGRTVVPDPEAVLVLTCSRPVLRVLQVCGVCTADGVQVVEAEVHDGSWWEIGW